MTPYDTPPQPGPDADTTQDALPDLAISAVGVDKTYRADGGGRVHALKSVDLEVPRGRIFGLLGPNGAGKSTFINILAGLVIKTGGTAKVWGIDIDREVYVGAVVDRDSQRITLMACAEGGVEIEEIAAATPERILKESADPVTGLSAFQARRLAYGLGLEGEAHKKGTAFLLSLYRAFAAEDASLAEINPLVITKGGDVMALDAKLNFDDNAEFRHHQWGDLRDDSEEDAAELEAKKHDLSYVSLDGTIGCMVNGAGLAMATMDIIKQFGGEPANFLDVGGGASTERVTAAFKIILSDKNVKGIFVNIFGGIVFCDMVAQGVVDAAKEVGLAVPLVVRLEGTNVEAGRKIIAESGLNVTTADDMADGARKIVELSR